MSDPQPTDNLNVIKDWKAGKNARNHRGTLWADGPVLWSQHHKIGHRTKAGVCVIADLTLGDVSDSYNTQTTLMHIHLAKKYADTIFHQLVSESSPLFMRELPF
jgi:hypothetical protein